MGRRWSRRADGFRVYDNPGAELHARMWRVDTLGWAWAVTQWGRPLASGTVSRMAEARAEANAWLDTCEEVTPAAPDMSDYGIDRAVEAHYRAHSSSITGIVEDV